MSHEFRVISDIYRILAEHDPATIENAARLDNISPIVREAITALAREARLRARKKPELKNALSRRNSDRIARRAPQGHQNNALQFLLRSERFRSKDDLMNFSRALGLALKEDRRASRERLARRLLHAVSKDPALRERFDALMNNASANQTSGWFDLITSKR